jgi:hypothetical protein
MLKIAESEENPKKEPVNNARFESKLEIKKYSRLTSIKTTTRLTKKRYLKLNLLRMCAGIKNAGNPPK